MKADNKTAGSHTRPHPETGYLGLRISKMGKPAGALIVPPGALAPVISVIAYGPDDFVEDTITDVEQVKQYLGKWPVVWVNVDGLGDVAVVERLGELFGLHRLALEDALSVPQRPKTEEYADHLFITTKR